MIKTSLFQILLLVFVEEAKLGCDVLMRVVLVYYLFRSLNAERFPKDTPS